LFVGNYETLMTFSKSKTSISLTCFFILVNRFSLRKQVNAPKREVDTPSNASPSKINIWEELCGFRSFFWGIKLVLQNQFGYKFWFFCVEFFRKRCLEGFLRNCKKQSKIILISSIISMKKYPKTQLTLLITKSTANAKYLT